MFCDAMVTMNSGSAIPVIAATEKPGSTSSGCGIHPAEGSGALAAITPTATATAAGTASSRLIRATTAQASTMASPATGCSAPARTGARHSTNRMPASMAFASGAGIAATARPSGFHSPAAVSSTPQTRKAPTASAKPPAGAAVAASSAAPGVDQATLTGRRSRSDSRMPASPIATDSAISPEAACAGLAPTATSPCSTTAKEDAKPTNPASSPAETACISASPSAAGRAPRRSARRLPA